MRCLYCNKKFAMLAVTQKYCSAKCGKEYRKKYRGKIQYPSVTFQCSQCGKTVVTEEGSGDMRTRFCCVSCEKKFWKRPHWEDTSERINFRNIAEYAGWEKKTNT